jgi:two-component system cell cycle sensor histidine kinase/response regulator CckA
VIGRGDRAAAQLWDGERVVGFICTDNLLSGRSVTLRDAELLRLYAVNLAHLYTRKMAEEELRRQRDFADALIATAPVIVVVLDADCRIIRINSFAEKLLGYSLAEVEGKNWISTFVSPRQRRRIRRAFEGSVSAVATNGSVSGIVTRDGSIRQIEWYDQAIKDAQGSSVAVLAIGLDVTDRIRYEDEVRQSQKMEAIGRLAGGIAHDFNNQLTVIKGYSDLLLRQLAADSDVRDQVLEIQKAAGQAEALTAQLLAFSRKQILQPRVLSLPDVLEDMRRSLDRMTGERIELKTVTGKGLWSVSADPSQVRQAIMNVVINSRDAMEAGGILTIRTKNVVLGRAYSLRHKGAKPGPHVAMSLRDTGVGMDKQTLGRALEPFFTTKPVGKGTGLGLAMVYGFVKQSGGHMTLTSRPGKGTTVRIYLPAVWAKADRLHAPTPRTHRSRGSARILLVEDEESVRKLAVRFLGDSGYNVVEAGDVPSALAVLHHHGGRIDLLVTDVAMPGKSGVDLADEMRKVYPRLPVLFVSGYADGESMKRSLLPGLEQLLGKPFRPEDLGNGVRSLLDAAKRVQQSL